MAGLLTLNFTDMANRIAIFRLHWLITNAETGERIRGNDSYTQKLDELPTMFPANFSVHLEGGETLVVNNPEIKLPFNEEFSAVIKTYNYDKERNIRKEFDEEFFALIDKYDAYLQIFGEYRGDDRTVGERLKFNSRESFYDTEEIKVKVECNIIESYIEKK